MFKEAKERTVSMSFHVEKCRHRRILCPPILTAIFAVAAAGSAMAQGIALRGVSAVNESMGGAAVACPLDAAGAMHWNPASITDLPSSEISFSMAMVLPQSSLGSSVAANTYYSGSPALSGCESGEAGAVPGPSMAFVQKVAESKWSYGLGIMAIGGSAVNYPASANDPILMKQPFGLGQLAANVDIYQIIPTAAYQLTDHWSVGFSPTLTMGKLYADPLFLGEKVDGEWAAGIGTRYVWGGGCQGGVYYKGDAGWNFGASLASPQWMEPFRYKSISASGTPVSVEYALNYPMVASIGTAYTGFERWTIACDVRYFDYANTPGFSESGLNADGSLRGLGWNSIMAVALGVQREVNERLTVRAGYCFNENPISSDAVQYNVASPLITQHTAHIGASYIFPEDWIASIAYTHAFENSATGPLHTAAGVAIPGSSVTSTVSADALSMGVTKRF
jgi:long-chain fatty acid transport protein